jgi:hypothetical protein
VLLHIIEEFARHAGQADIIRESVDGATMYELLFALDGSWAGATAALAWLCRKVCTASESRERPRPAGRR